MMAKLSVSFPIRKCIVNHMPAYFHIWAHEAKPIAPAVGVGGHGGGQVSYVIGIIERLDGSVHKAYPEEIKFVGSEEFTQCMKEYYEICGQASFKADAARHTSDE